MKRRAEYLVEKRDGRQEWLRATKLARSLHLALESTEATAPWLAVDLAETVLVALRRRKTERASERVMLTTLEIADAVQQVLLATGYAAAAWSYLRVGAERRRRGALLALEGRDQTAGLAQEYSSSTRALADDASAPRLPVSPPE